MLFTGCYDLTPTLRILPLLALLLSQAAVAQGVGGTRAPDNPILRQQAKAEDLYRSGHWERAYFIYVNDLAAVGDKYAQYMAGYMWLNGKGVSRDAVRASAWYRLAAERGDAGYVAVRDELLESMSESDLALSDEIFIALRKKYSDLVLALGHLRKERMALEERPTGSRLPGGSSLVTIVDPRTGQTITRSEYERRIASSMKVRLDYITDKLDIDEVEPDMSNREFEDLVSQVETYLLKINDR